MGIRPNIDLAPICSITPFTLLDFPDLIACILWFSGCNFRCKYCHNPELVNCELKRLSPEEIDNFLNSRKESLEGVVLSGGECTIFSHLPKFISYVKTKGYKVKIDTNGSNPQMIEELLKKNLVDYIALDYKAPLTTSKYKNITGYNDTKILNSTLELLCNNAIPFEVRTTVHSDLLNEDDINIIIDELESYNFKASYYIQNFQEAKTLSAIAKQHRIINLDKIKKSNNFKICFRNF